MLVAYECDLVKYPNIQKPHVLENTDIDVERGLKELNNACLGFDV